MSNHSRRRHLHTPRENRAERARAEYENGRLPCVPGVIKDREQTSIDEAMAQAHHVLPYLPGTQVCIRLYDLDNGYEVCRELFGEGCVLQLKNMVLARGGTDPTIVISTREVHEHG